MLFTIRYGVCHSKICPSPGIHWLFAWQDVDSDSGATDLSVYRNFQRHITMLLSNKVGWTWWASWGFNSGIHWRTGQKEHRMVLDGGNQESNEVSTHSVGVSQNDRGYQESDGVRIYGLINGFTSSNTCILNQRLLHSTHQIDGIQPIAAYNKVNFLAPWDIISALCLI